MHSVEVSSRPAGTADRQGAHHEARLEALSRFACVPHLRSNRLVPLVSCACCLSKPAIWPAVDVGRRSAHADRHRRLCFAPGGPDAGTPCGSCGGRLPAPGRSRSSLVDDLVRPSAQQRQPQDVGVSLAGLRSPFTLGWRVRGLKATEASRDST